MIVSAYDNKDKLVEGKLYESPIGTKVVLTESGYINVDSLNHVRFVEDEKEVDEKVKSDVEHLSTDLLKKKDQKALEDAGEKREKELQDAGMKIEDGQYATKFVIETAAKASSADQDVDPAKMDINNSDACKDMLGESMDDPTPNGLHSDYQDVMPYEDNLTRDEIYLKMKKEIDKYGKNTKKFDDKELEEHLCNNLLGGFIIHENTLKETFNKIYNLCTLRELTTAKVVDAINNDGEEALRNKFIKLRDQGLEDYNPEDKLDFINELVDQLKEDEYSEAEVAEILGKWFGIGGTYEFDMDVLNRIASAKEDGQDITEDHPNWYPQNEENVWNNGTNIQQVFA